MVHNSVQETNINPGFYRKIAVVTYFYDGGLHFLKFCPSLIWNDPSTSSKGHWSKGVKGDRALPALREWVREGKNALHMLSKDLIFSYFLLTFVMKWRTGMELISVKVWPATSILKLF